jgi:hypothetical protein
MKLSRRASSRADCPIVKCDRLHERRPNALHEVTHRSETSGAEPRAYRRRRLNQGGILDAVRGWRDDQLVAKVTGKLQITLPKALADRCRIRVGDELELRPV